MEASDNYGLSGFGSVQFVSALDKLRIGYCLVHELALPRFALRCFRSTLLHIRVTRCKRNRYSRRNLHISEVRLKYADTARIIIPFCL